jgi:hypothetical protein
MQKRSIFGALTAVAVMATAAYAIVTFDVATGTGFVGKGDVQTLLGLNNKAMQNVHTQVTFKYVATTEYSFDCEWYTGPDHNRTHHVNTKTEDFGINSSVASESRKTGQWTGWNLNGYTGAAPGDGANGPVDADCGAEGNDMKSIVPGSIAVISSTGGLFAVYNGVDYALTVQ